MTATDVVSEDLATLADGARSNRDSRAAVGSNPVRLAAQALDLERHRVFLWSPVCLGAGIAGYFALPVEPSMAVAWLPALVAMIAVIAAPRGSVAAVALAACCLAGVGFGLAKLRVEAVRAPVLEKPLRRADVTGIVRLAESRAPRGQRLTLDVVDIAGLDRTRLPKRVRIRTLKNPTPLVPGDRVRLTATLSPPSKPALPGGFDFARTAWFEQLGGVGYAMAAPVVEGRDTATGARAQFDHAIDALRTTIGARVKAVLPGESGAIATALITGERGGISEETNQAFKDSGLFHILSISGLHMVVMAGAVFYVVRLMLALVPGVALVLPIKKIAAVSGIVAALIYLAISGGAFATVRAAVMIAVMFAAVLFDRPALALRNVALAALLILALYPESLFDAGFQMSFAAVTGLIAAYEEVRRRRVLNAAPPLVMRLTGFFGGIIASTLIASIAVAPFAAYHFHQSQQYAVFANLIAIPICNLIVMPAALLAIVLMPFSLESWALWPLGKGIEVMTWCADAVARIPGAVGHLAQIPWSAFALMVGGGLWLALWQTRWRLMGLASILSGLALAPTLARPDVLIGRNGDLVAVRMADGLLSALPARQSKFELERWLLADGDGRDVSTAQKGSGFTCDASGCTARVKGVLVAVSRHPSAFVDDCAAARVLIADVPRPATCTAPEIIVDLFDMWRNASYALYVSAADASGKPAIRTETVAEFRGDRPWAAVRAVPAANADRRRHTSATPAPPGSQRTQPIVPATPDADDEELDPASVQ